MRPGGFAVAASGCSSQAHIIGVVVSEITQRDHHRRRQRHRELAEQPPDLAAHEQQRDEHRHQRQADRQHREADLARAEQRGLEAVHALLDVAAGVLQHDDRVVDHEAGGHRQRHQAQVVEAEAEQVHHAEGAEQRDDGGRPPGSAVARTLRRKALTTSTTSTIEISSVISISCSEARIELVRSEATCSSMSGGSCALQLGQQRAHAVDGLDDVGAGLARDQHDDRRLAVEQAQRAHVLDAVADLGDVGQAHRRAVAPGDDQVAVVGGACGRRPCVPV